jgi:two-component system chemotaxis response regulator CheB
MKKIRVLIIEDSDVVRELLRHIISGDPRLEVAGAVGNAEEAIRLLPSLSPDIITMDIRLPGMSGFQATQHIQSVYPTPIIVVSDSIEAEDLKISTNALKAGALSVVEKPVGVTHQEYAKVSKRLCDQLVIMSEVRPIRQNRNWADSLPGDPSASPSNEPQKPSRRPGPFEAVAIVSSTGGPNALMQVLNGLGEDFRLPILVVQHIAESFLEGFADWLNGVSPQTVKIAAHGEIPSPGTVYLPPADRHLKIIRGKLVIDSGAKVCHQRPSGDILFRSMAQSLGRKALGVLLTGMGEDGAMGLLEIRNAGGYALAEDPSTAVVFGMPGAAIRLGGVDEVVPLPEIAPRVRALVTGKQESA